MVFQPVDHIAEISLKLILSNFKRIFHFQQKLMSNENVSTIEEAKKLTREIKQRGGDANLSFWPIFPQKLHENKINCTQSTLLEVQINSAFCEDFSKFRLNVSQWEDNF